jgi:hypothetical protein
MTTHATRRAILAGAAAVLPALAMPAPAAPVDNGTDAELIALGNRFEPLLAAYMTAIFEWAPLARTASEEFEAHPKFVAGYLATKRQRRAQSRLLNAIHKRNGCAAANDRMTALNEDMLPIAEAITDTAASSLGGLRAKVLVLLWETRPTTADHEGQLEFADDGNASRSLFMAAAELTGLGPMVREIEGRFAADATVSGDEAVRS